MTKFPHIRPEAHHIMVNRDEIYVVYESIHISVADASLVVIDTILKVTLEMIQLSLLL